MGFYFPRIFILDFGVISVVRQMIMSGCAAFAQVVGPTRIEAELLPQWWEQVKNTGSFLWMTPQARFPVKIRETTLENHSSKYAFSITSPMVFC